MAFAVRAMVAVKSGRPEQHRKWMWAAASLVIGFVASYALKLFFLGREDLSVWSARDVNILRFHETCVLVMLVGGGLAFRFGGKLRTTRVFTRNDEDPLPDANLIARHRLAGRLGIGGTVLGFISAGFVLAGMYQRLG